MTGYLDAVGVDVNVNGEGWGAKFSASTRYKEVKEGTSMNHNIYIESVAKCSFYQASASNRIGLSKNFIDDVTNLPVGKNTLSSYLSFINTYGTHYVAEVVMGAKSLQQNKFDETGVTSLKVC